MPRLVKPEDRVHMLVVAALRSAGAMFFHVPNEQALLRLATPRQKHAHLSQLHAMGVSSGVPDLILVRPGFPPCALELKAGRGKLSDAQLAWGEALRLCGWLWACETGEAAALARVRLWGWEIGRQPWEC